MTKTFQELRAEKEQIREGKASQDINVLRRLEREQKNNALKRSMLNEEAQKKAHAYRLFESGVYLGAFRKEDEEKVVRALLHMLEGKEVVTLEEARTLLDQPE